MRIFSRKRLAFPFVIRWLKGHMAHTSWCGNEFLIGWDKKRGRRIVWGENQTGLASFTFSLTQTHACTICPAWFLLSDTHKRHCWLNSDSVLPDSNFRIKEETIAFEFTDATTGMCLAAWVCIICVCVSMLSIPLNNEANTHFTASFCYLLVFLIPYNCCFESRHNPGSCRDMLYPVPGICKWKLLFHLFLLTWFFLALRDRFHIYFIFSYNHLLCVKLVEI